MSDKTNEEKLRILKERLATIQQKKETNYTEEVKKDKPVAPVFEEDLVNERKPESDSTRKKSSAWKIIFFLILFAFFGGIGYYSYNNDFKMDPTIENIKKDFDDMYVSLFGNDNKDEDDKEKKKKKKKVIYNKSSFDGNFIIVLNTFDEKELADDEAQSLSEKGYKSGVFLLSDVSNSEEEVVQTYIGPFNKEGEANQYLNSTNLTSKGGIIELQ
ncbi:MAG: hypothetical protein HOJ12_04675 [Flavobacteriales bacterium]|jgi:hypothetical protein|nr:hypothetical protein [Flavobacteriales bacterium]MDG2059838.1 SPOR domain-containing protein [Flavobacteriales bacterium]